MLAIDLTGKRALVAGVSDDGGFGFAIAKALAEAGATICVGSWPPALGIFTKLLERGKMEESLRLSDGRKLEFERIYPLDAAFDTLAEVPSDIRENKRYKERGDFTIQGMAGRIREDFGERVIPGYGGGMSSAKAALEADTRTLAFEAGRRWGVRINAISAGPWASRAASAIGFVDTMIAYSAANSPLPHPIQATDVGHAAAFLLSPLAGAITASVVYVDNGFHAMGMAVADGGH